MNTSRPHPFTLVFGELAAEKFPAVRDALGGDLRLEHFLMTPAAVELLHELRPDEGLGDAVDDFVAFVHAAVCFWDAGERTVLLVERDVRSAMEGGGRRTEGGEGEESPPSSTLHPPLSMYFQLPPRIVWSRVEGSDFHEPLDGWFAIAEGEDLRVVACLGVHPERPGLSVLTAVGPKPVALRREDGTAPFSPTMEGGAEAGLHSVADADELLWLAWRSERQEARGEK